jgi:membrane associated rhomboid family serine protease
MTERAAVSVSFPRPRGALLWVMVTILVAWVGFAIAINWAGVGGSFYQLLVVDRDGVARGELWRLLTAPFLHDVSGRGGVSHVVTTLLLLYFFGPPLQKTLGDRKMLAFLVGAALAGEVLQLMLDWALPGQVAPAVHQKVLLGGLAMGVATTVAWGFSNPKQQVLMMMVLPISGVTLVWFTVGFYILTLIAVGSPAEGVFAPFGGMFCGYLLAGGNPSPLRRAFLRWKLGKIERAGERKASPPRPSHLRVIRGLKEDDEPPKGGGDKRWLN